MKKNKGNRKVDNTRKTKKSENKFLNFIITSLKDYMEFYKKHIKTKQIIITVIMLILFFVLFNYFSVKISSVPKEEISSLIDKGFVSSVFKEKIPILFLIIFAGITPYIYIPVLGVAFAYNLSLNVSAINFLNNNFLLLCVYIIGSIIQMVGISLCVATGIHYCTQSTKKFRYSQYVGFGVKDVKKAIYSIKKDEEKFNKLEEKENKKAIEREKLNVKVPYKFMLISFIIASLLIIIGSIFIR